MAAFVHATNGKWTAFFWIKCFTVGLLFTHTLMTAELPCKRWPDLLGATCFGSGVEKLTWPTQSSDFNPIHRGSHRFEIACKPGP